MGSGRAGLLVPAELVVSGLLGPVGLVVGGLSVLLAQ